MNSIPQFLANIWKGLASLTPARKISLVVASVVTLSFLGVFVHVASRPEFRVLFSNLSSEDAGDIVSRLQEKKVPYRISPAGDAVSVPAEKVTELRLELAAAGVPRGGNVGFEIFDNKTFGSTEFEQQLNYRRALQGELSRTINSLDEVKQSRVHIVLPKDSLFLEEQKKPTASVTIKLKEGRNLHTSQVDGIVHLVASSVEGLNPEDVMIVDSRGNILSRVKSESSLVRLSNSQTEYQRNIEKDLAGRIQSMLENVVGPGKAVIRVSADLNFQVTEKTEETYDPEAPVIRSMQRQTEKTNKGGAPGSSDNPGHEKIEEVINYEINKAVNKTVMPVGDIQRLSIAVLVDGIYRKNEKGAEVYEPRSKKELEGIEELVRKSAGFSVQRGDQVVVTSMPFKNAYEESGRETTPWQEKITVFYPLIRYGVIFVVAVLVFMFVLRPLLRELLTGKERAETRSLPSVAGKLEAGQSPLAIGLGDEKPLTEQELARQMASADAKKFADLLRNWLR